MPIFQFGFMIKHRREELGYTQEDLADGICSVPTLSRIENGERMPTREHFEMLIQRLGYSDTMLDVYVDEKQFRLHELKFQIRQAIILNQLETAQNLLIEYERYIEKPIQIEIQFIILCRTLSDSTAYRPEERLKILEGAIRLTCPKYEISKFPRILSFEEILILNNIAVCYAQMGNYEPAIGILSHLKQYYENHMMNPEEVLRTQPLILYNLSKYLGCSSRYDECIEIADLGIRIARNTGQCSFMDGLLYNRAWALVRRKRHGDKDAAILSAKQARSFALIMEKTDAITLYSSFILNNFPNETY